jgi:hypothetical protein
MLKLKRPWYTPRGADRATGPTVEAALDISDASALTDLQMHWGEVYAIGLDGDIWSARFEGSADELRAHTSQELRELIRTDYTHRQQSRSAQGAGGSSGLGGPAAGGPSLDSADDDTFDAYDVDDDDVDDDDDEYGARDGREGADQSAARPPHVNFGDIRGERMST